MPDSAEPLGGTDAAEAGIAYAMVSTNLTSHVMRLTTSSIRRPRSSDERTSRSYSFEYNQNVPLRSLNELPVTFRE